MINTTVPHITQNSLLLEFDKVCFLKFFVIHCARKYPIIVPKVFVIRSFMSVVLKVKICDISITQVVKNPVRMTLFVFLNPLHNVGKKKPNGTNKSIFKHALAKSDIISAKGITFTEKSNSSNATLGKPTSAKIAVIYNPNIM